MLSQTADALVNAIDAIPPLPQFAPPIRLQSALRQAITVAYRRSELQCVPPLVAASRVSEPMNREDCAQSDRNPSG